MEAQIDQYIENLITSCLQHPNFSSLTPEQKEQTAENLRDHFYNIIMDTVIDNLDADQINQIKDLQPGSPELAAKIEEFTSTMPDFLTQVDKQLTGEAETIKTSGQIPQDI